MCGDGPPTVDKVQQMHFAHALFFETLRLKPSVPGDGKAPVLLVFLFLFSWLCACCRQERGQLGCTPIGCNSSCRRQHSGCVTACHFSIHSLHLIFFQYHPYTLNRNPAVYKDPEKFDPDRWLDEGKGELKERPAHEFSSFNVAPRLCLGKPMAIMEAKILLVEVVRRFKLRLKPGFRYKVGIHFATLRPHACALVHDQRDSVLRDWHVHDCGTSQVAAVCDCEMYCH